MQGFVFRLIPPRPTFQSDMTDVERAAMARHGAYWRERLGEGKVVAFGPVADPAGAYGLGVVVVGGQRPPPTAPSLRRPTAR